VGAGVVNAQEYEDLKGLWVDQKYEKLAEKAEKYTTKDKTKNDPLPYLYLSKALFRISLDETLKSKEQYKKAETDALSYAVKYKKKDKGNVYKQEADEFFCEMKKFYFEQTENYYSSGDAKKASGIIKKVVQFDELNPGAWILKGVMELELKDKTNGVKSTTTGVDLVKKIQNFNDLCEPDQTFLRYTLMEYTKYLLKVKDKPGAKQIISLGYQYYQNVKDENGDPIKGNEEYVALYNQVTNG
jgi:hypothetical protein